jgi:hypothetical protein
VLNAVSVVNVPVKDKYFAAFCREVILTYSSSDWNIVEYAKPRRLVAFCVMAWRPNDGDSISYISANDGSAGFDRTTRSESSTMERAIVEID